MTYNEEIVSSYLANASTDERPYVYYYVALEAKVQRNEGEDVLSWEGWARDDNEACALAIIEHQHDYDPDIAVAVVDILG